MRMHRSSFWFAKLSFMVLCLGALLVSCSQQSTQQCTQCQPGTRSCNPDRSAILDCKMLVSTQCWQLVQIPCTQGTQCVAQQGTALCSNPTGGCTNACQPGARRCDGKSSVTCIQGPNGCGVWSAPQACAVDEVCDALSGQCLSSNCTPTQPQQVKQCVGNAIYWFDNCGTQGALVQQCQTNETCDATSAQCTAQGCTPTQPQKEKRCVDDAIHWFDDCDKQGALVETCQAPQTCQAGACVQSGCTPTQPQKEKRCVGDAIHWFDDCGKQGALVQQCQTNETCQAGACKPATNTGCTGQHACQSGATRCQNSGVQSCEENAQTKCREWGSAIPCSSGQVCKSGACVKDSTSTGGGGIGAACKQGSDCASKTCLNIWSGGYCSVDCGRTQGVCPSGSGSKCLGIRTSQGNIYACLKTCTSNANCRSGYTCHSTHKVCTPDSGSSGGCKSNADCPSGQTCNTSNGQCATPPCTSDAQCPSGQKCTNGTCVTPPCTSNADCPSGQSCKSGVCQGAGQAGKPGTPETRNVSVNGTTLQYILYVSKNYTGTSAAPVLMLFHGKGDSASNFLQTSGWRTIADSNGIILALPNKSGGMWDAYNPSGTDVQFADKVLQDVRNNHNTNAKRLYVVGFSQGGYFSFLYGMTRSTTLAAFGVQAASRPISGLNASRKIAVAFVIGDQDSAYSRAQQDSQTLKNAGHPVKFIALPGQGHCCAAQSAKNTDVWNFFKQYPLP